MKRAFLIVFLLAFSLSAQDPVTVDELRDHIYFLADDALEGRKPGTPGGDKAAQYIRDYFSEAGLELLGDKGLQDFEIISAVSLDDGNALSFAGKSYTVMQDFSPLWFSDNGSLNAPVVFAGYGFQIDEEELSWDDYAEVDVKGKWALILLGDPEPDNPHSEYGFHAQMRKKVQVATDNGAAGVIFVAGPQWDDEDQLPSLDRRYEALDKVPVIRIKRSVADALLEQKSVADLESTLNETSAPQSLEMNKELSATTALKIDYDTTHNVAALVRGQNAAAEEYIVIGAHYDHLGYGGPGSGSRAIDTLAIHNGADDNASGVAAMLEIAEYFATLPQKPQRSLLFLAFGAEEMGLLGSKFFVDNPLLSMDDLRLMINLDMVGRLDESKGLTVGGTGTSTVLDSLVKEGAAELALEVSTQDEGSGPSDHASFYGKDKPVLFFFSGTHQDYHKPSDDADKINYTGIQKIAGLVTDIALDQAVSRKALAFQEAGPRERTMRTSFKVTFGVMPDYASDVDGMRLDDVRKDGPAGKAGMQSGDVIKAINGNKISNIYDYMNRLADLKEGDLVDVTVMREGQELSLKLQL